MSTRLAFANDASKSNVQPSASITTARRTSVSNTVSARSTKSTSLGASGAEPLCTDSTSGVPAPVCAYVVVIHGITRLICETFPLCVNREVQTSLAWLSMYSAAIAPGSCQCSCATSCQRRPTASIIGWAAPEIASADTNFASVLGMYANPVSDSRPATSGARSASHPLLSTTIQQNTNILSLASIVSGRSSTNLGHEGTRPSAFSSAVRK